MKILSSLLLFLILAFAGHAQNGYVPTTIKTATFELTRPTNTAAYSALDVVANSVSGTTLSTPVTITITPVASPKNSNSPIPAYGNIVKAVIATTQTTCVARFRIHLFTATLTPLGDNDAYTALYTNKLIDAGYIDFPACVTDGAGSSMAFSQVLNSSFPFKLPSSSVSIYAIFETLDAFTPDSDQKFFIKLIFDSN